jgi:hypothetical protein
VLPPGLPCVVDHQARPLLHQANARPSSQFRPAQPSEKEVKLVVSDAMRCTGANLPYPSTLPAHCPIAPTGARSIAAPIAMHRRMVVRSLRYSHRRPSTRSGVAPTAPTGCGEARCGRSYSALPPESRPNPKRIKSEGSPVAIRETEAHIQLQIRPAGFTTVMTPSAP